MSEKCGTINTAIPCEGVRLITCDTANVIKERNQKHIEDDYGIYECWDKIVRILPEDAQATIHYLEKIADQSDKRKVNIKIHYDFVGYIPLDKLMG